MHIYVYFQVKTTEWLKNATKSARFAYFKQLFKTIETVQELKALENMIGRQKRYLVRQHRKPDDYSDEYLNTNEMVVKPESEIKAEIKLEPKN